MAEHFKRVIVYWVSLFLRMKGENKLLSTVLCAATCFPEAVPLWENHGGSNFKISDKVFLCCFAAFFSTNNATTQPLSLLLKCISSSSRRSKMFSPHLKICFVHIETGNDWLTFVCSLRSGSSRMNAWHDKNTKTLRFKPREIKSHIACFRVRATAAVLWPVWRSGESRKSRLYCV